jgi:flavin-dependent dehydrogenase
MRWVLYFIPKTKPQNSTPPSIVKKKLAGIYPDKNHQGGAIRAYFKNVSVRDKDTTEIYMQKHFMPGYFWIFPLPDNRCNVGFGMISKQISLRKINLRKSFHEFIEASSLLKEKFKGAEIEGNLEGFSLPLGSKRIPVSGEHFLLAGDAASLIDPLTGDGIGNAMLSGRLAAKQIRKSFAKDDFSASYMKRYDNKLFKTIGRELKQRYYLQRIFHLMPSLLRWIFLIKGRKSLDSEA